MVAVDRSPSPSSARTQGVVALLFVQLFFGLFPLLGKLAFAHFPPRSVGAWRMAVGATVLMSLALVVHGRAAWLRREDWGRMLLCALLGIVLNMVLFLEGLERSTAVNTALLLPLIPVFTAVAAVVLRQERFDWSRALGMALAFSGAGLILFQRGHELSSAYLTGNLLVVANEICYAFYLVLARPLLSRYPPLVVIAWVFGLSVWAIPLLVRDSAAIAPPAADTRAWLALAYIVVFPTIVTYLLNAYALARVSASTTAVFIFLQPLITVVGGVVWLGEALPEHVGWAAALTFCGVWWVVRRPATRPVASVASSEPGTS